MSYQSNDWSRNRQGEWNDGGLGGSQNYPGGSQQYPGYDSGERPRQFSGDDSFRRHEGYSGDWDTDEGRASFGSEGSRGFGQGDGRQQFDQGRFGQRGSYGAGEYGRGQFGQGEYGQGQYGQRQYGQGRHGQDQFGNRYGQGFDRGERSWSQESGRGYREGASRQDGQSYYPQRHPGQEFGEYQGGYGHEYDQHWRGADMSGGYGDGSYQTGRHAGRGPKGYQRSDERIREEVSDELTDDPNVDASEISVEVRDGEVTLSGSVQSREEKRAAETCVEHVSGVREVINQLRVSRMGSSGESSTGSSQSSGGRSQGQSGQSGKGGRSSSEG